jgi:hypothetical protein
MREHFLEEINVFVLETIALRMRNDERTRTREETIRTYAQAGGDRQETKQGPADRKQEATAAATIARTAPAFAG